MSQTEKRARAITFVALFALIYWTTSRANAQARSGVPFGSGTQREPGQDRKKLTKKSTKTKQQPSGGGVIDVDSPRKRPATEAEKKRAQQQLAKRPPGTVSASPELEPRHGQTPAGYDPGKARAQAQGIAAHLAAKGPRAYDRNRLAQWQTLCGVRADGVYGGSTRGALVHYGVSNPPRPFVAPYATLPYHPPE